MVLRKFFSIILLFCVLLAVTNSKIHTTQAKNSNVVATFEKAEQPFQEPNGFFTENKGQWNSEILFMGNTSFGKVAFTKEAIYYQLIRTDENINNFGLNPFFNSINSSDLFQENRVRSTETQIIKLTFIDGKTQKIQGEENLPHYNNYFIGNDQKKWGTYCKNFSKVFYEDIWKGIDLAYFFTPEGMKYEYYIEPEADIEKLQVYVEGAEVNSYKTRIVFETSLGSINDDKLSIFEYSNKSSIEGYFFCDKNTISFKNIPKKRKNRIIIDPVIWSTYFGSTTTDIAGKVAIDHNDQIYICGATSSTVLPLANNVSTLNGSIFIAKYNASGQLLFSTFYGGSFSDEVNDIQIDSNNNVIINGRGHSYDLPNKNNNHSDSYWCAFASKINSDGLVLVSTYFGPYAGGEDDFRKVAFDSYHNIYFAGGAYNLSGNTDAIIAKYDANLNFVKYVYVGGSSSDGGSGIAIDGNDNIFISGVTESSNFIKAINSMNYYRSGFISKLNSNLDILVSSYFGGNGMYDYVYDMAIDSNNNAYIVGSTDSNDLPLSINLKTSAGEDAFLAKFDTNCSLILSAYYGGSQNFYDAANSIKIDSIDNVYIAGCTCNKDLPGADNTHLGFSDGFVAIFDENCVIQKSTYFGGSSSITGILEGVTGFALDTSKNIYVTGTTISNDLPMRNNEISIGDSIYDAYLAKISFGNYSPSSPKNPQGVRIDPESIKICWDASDPGTYPLVNYKIYKSQSDIFSTASVIKTINDLSLLEWTDIEANIETDHFYWITALDNASPPNESFPSSVVAMYKQTITKPYPPLNVGVTRIDENNVRVYWFESVKGTYDIEKYRIYISINGDIVTHDVFLNDSEIFNKVIKDSSKNPITLWMTAIDIKGNESDYSNVLIQNALPTLFVHGWKALTETRYDETEIWSQMISNMIEAINTPPNARMTPSEVQNTIRKGAIEVECYNYGKYGQKNEPEIKKWNFYRFEYAKQHNSPLGVFYISNYNCNINPTEANPTSEHILLYSLRLKYEIEKIKEIENVEKVNIIAHSMGGLIARGLIESKDFIKTQYLTGYGDSIDKKTGYFLDEFKKSMVVQFGKKFQNEITNMYTNNTPPVNKVIMLGTPNHGAMNRQIYRSGNVVEIIKEYSSFYPNYIDLKDKYLLPYYRSTFDMDPSSHFLNILNYGEDSYGNFDKYDDITNDQVKYYSLAGQLSFNTFEKQYSKSPPIIIPGNHDFFRYDNPSIYDTLMAGSLIKNLDKRTLYDDGFIQAASVRLRGKNCIHYPLAISCHSSIIKEKSFSNLVFDILYSICSNNMDKENFLYERYWNQYTQIGSFYQLLTYVASPVDILLTDQNGNNVGFNNGEIVTNISGSYVSIMDQIVVIFAENEDKYKGLSCRIKGQETLLDNADKYGLCMSLINPLVKNDISMDSLSNPYEYDPSIIYFSLNQPTQTNQLDYYYLNWQEYFNQKDYSMLIRKDLNGDGVVDESINSINSAPILQGEVDYDLINLQWTKPSGGSYPIRTYQVFRSNNNLSFSLVGETNATSFTDKTGKKGEFYTYFVVAVDIHNYYSPPSQKINLGPVLELPKPELDLSIEMNKKDFQYGEDVFFKIVIFNFGNGEAHDSSLLITFPDEIQYKSSDKYAGIVQPSGQVVYRLGTIPRRSKITFQINGSVVIKVIQERSVTIKFAFDAKDIEIISKSLNCTILPKKSGDSGSGKNINLQLLNLKIDPNTGERYLETGSELELLIKISDFNLPYKVEIFWGDGEEFYLDNQNESSLSLKHIYTSKGMMEIKIRVTDNYGNTKEVSTRISVR